MIPPLFQLNIRYYGHDQPEVLAENQKLKGCTFMFTEYPGTDEGNFIEKWTKIIEENGGHVTSILAHSTHLVCKTRTTELYHQALRDRKRCVTLFWLQDVLLLSKTMQHPWKPLHVPLPFAKDSLPCEDHVISVTNFEGKERTELKEMITNIGAIYTENMTSKNTILICRHPGGQKYKKALQWNLAIVNATWINEVLLGSKNAVQLMLVLPKYQSFNNKDPLKLTDYSLIKDVMHPWTVPIRVFPYSSSPQRDQFGNVENYENHDSSFGSLISKNHLSSSLYSHLHRAHTNGDEGHIFIGDEKSSIGLRRLDPNEALMEIKNVDPNANFVQL